MNGVTSPSKALEVRKETASQIAESIAEIHAMIRDELSVLECKVSVLIGPDGDPSDSLDSNKMNEPICSLDVLNQLRSRSMVVRDRLNRINQRLEQF